MAFQPTPDHLVALLTDEVETLIQEHRALQGLQFLWVQNAMGKALVERFPHLVERRVVVAKMTNDNPSVFSMQLIDFWQVGDKGVHLHEVLPCRAMAHKAMEAAREKAQGAEGPVHVIEREQPLQNPIQAMPSYYQLIQDRIDQFIAAAQAQALEGAAGQAPMTRKGMRL